MAIAEQTKLGANRQAFFAPYPGKEVTVSLVALNITMSKVNDALSRYANDQSNANADALIKALTDYKAARDPALNLINSIVPVDPSVPVPYQSVKTKLSEFENKVHQSIPEIAQAQLGSAGTTTPQFKTGMG